MPVISAVGHETDFTICDFVSDLRAPTPSAAAELAVPERTRLLAVIAGADGMLRRGMLKTMERSRERFEAFTSRPCMRQSERMLQPFVQRLDGASSRLKAAGKGCVLEARERQRHSAAKLEGLSPLSVLSRGYAMTLRDGRPVVSAGQTTVGDRLELVYQDGSLECEVLSKKEDASCRP